MSENVEKKPVLTWESGERVANARVCDGVEVSAHFSVSVRVHFGGDSGAPPTRRTAARGTAAMLEAEAFAREVLEERAAVAAAGLAALGAGAATSVAVLTDYHCDDGHRPYQGLLHTEAQDVCMDVNDLLRVMAESVASDGDEVRIAVRRTGRRPFGDRKVRFVGDHTYAREPKT